MAQQTINLGTANQGNGDPLRTAFNKVNENFTELYNQVAAGVVVDTIPPTSPGEGDLWWDPESGRMYVYYGTSWVDASPVDGAGISETSELVNGAYTVSLGTDGLLSVTGAVGWGLDENSPTLTDATINKVGNNLEIKTNLNLDPYTWSFSNLSKLTLPSGAVIDTYADGAENSTYFWGGNGQVIAVRGMNAENVYGGGIDIKPNGSVEIIAQDEYSATWTFTEDGNLSVPNRITFNDNSWQSTAFVGHAYSLRNNPNGSLYVTLDDSGTINTPLLLPLTFTAVLDPTHYIGEGTLVLEGDAWEFEVQFQVGMDGTVQTMIGNNTPWVSNPGYIDDLEFEFVEADHGIPGYTFTLGLYNVVQAGPAGWTTNLTASIPPEYPSTIKSLGAIKLSATGETVVPGQQIIASDAQGGITNDYITVWVEGGGTNYPEIVAVQPGWTVVGEGLNHVSVTNAELITQFPGSVIYRITTSISSAKMGYEYTFIEPDSFEPDLKNWVFGTDGQLTVPGAIFRDGGLYMNSSGSTTAASVFVSGNSGSVILRTANNAELISYDLTVDVDGETTFPGRLNFSDGSTLGDNILTGAIDSDLGLEIKRMVTVSGAHMGPNSPDVLLVDITEDDDITIVQAGWELNTGSEIAPIWLPVETVSRNENIYYLIAVSGVTFETGVTYTFRNPVPESKTWFIRNQTGGLVAPGGAIITNETAPLGGGGTYRELAIELPTPDELNEHRWVFDNDGDFTTPGNITVTGGLLTTYGAVVDVAVNTDNYLGLHANPNAGVLVRSSDTELNYSDWRFEVGGSVTFPDTSVQTTAYPGTLAAARLPYYDNTEARDTAITSPENSMIVIVGGDVYFYGAAQWRQLTVAA